MALPHLWRPPPGPRGMDEFLYHNWQHHLAVLSVLQATKNVSLQPFLLWPVQERHFQDFLDQHQLAHNAINGALGVIGNDISQVDFSNTSKRNEWLWQHFSEHQGWAQTLGGTAL